MGPGDVVDDRFEIERLAASGGMGEVFRGRDRLTDEIVAVKVLLGGQATDLERFRRETQVLARLSHPGIVRYVAHGTLPSGALYMVMEWLEGHDLEHRLQRGRLTVEESLTVASQVATALEAAHELGVVHRDIKPKNLFLVGGRLDRVKLIDFGIARAAGTVQMTQAGMLMGTPGYMAPEQCTSEQALDARADVYALGCLLFECLTGVPAFKGQHAMAVLVKVLFEPTPRVRDFLPEVPAELDELVAQMMAKELDVRPRSGTAVVTALAALGHSMVVVEEEAPDKEAASTKLSRHEQRLLSVIMISGPPVGQGLSAGAGGLLALPETEEVTPEVRQDVRSFGGTLERLIDGSMVVTLTGEWIATDQAALAARCALALGRRYPGRWIALATGYREAGRRSQTSRSPVKDAPPTSPSDAIARALGLLGPSLPPPGTDGTPSILIDEVTAGLLDARFEVQENIVGYLLAGQRTLPEGPRALLGRATACVGRERELGLLDQAFTGCVEESLAQAVLVTGPAGIGKTRLAQEFLSRLAKRGAEVSIWFGRGNALAADAALRLLGEAIQGACGLREEDPLALRREKLAAWVGRCRTAPLCEGDRQQLAAFVDELVGALVPVENSNTQRRVAHREALLVNEPMQALWLDVLRTECATRPLLLVLEDLHWSDLPTVHFIDVALRELRDRPWMVVGLGRPEMYERFRQLWNGPSVQVLPLQPLGRKAGERLVRQVLGEHVTPDTMNPLVDRSEGNPFYLEEFLRTAARRPGQVLPETVIAMVQSRLAVLGEEVRRMLRAASVFGEVFWMGGVARLLGSEEQLAWVREMLSSLVEQELLVRRAESRFPDEEEYAFRHALLREGAYAMLVKADRVLGHRLAGAWLQEHGESDPAVLAEHQARSQ